MVNFGVVVKAVTFATFRASVPCADIFEITAVVPFVIDAIFPTLSTVPLTFDTVVTAGKASCTEVAEVKAIISERRTPPFTPAPATVTYCFMPSTVPGI